MTIEAIPPLGSVGASPLALQLGPVAPPPVTASPMGGFGAMLMNGIGAVDARLQSADALVRQFAVDDGVPVHHVTMALEEARLSLELAMQVRGRLVEGYRELMNMQL
ncbi:flagellar hook-basal body complex protein FliE [Sphingomonas sanguinis]|uniref:Flagellar hook-basal body complex protein FliE n=1 Tax=Sphingomonas sanguinis TaxID=33051 RepID=A0ABU5LSA5_9SPHN|nr:flagellar hook-basal body complex protein FliE [Sphingomonas sanguinis]MDZ7282803.1 flagellar hook-basal body complex protein FliE [Sphingomonas sanguinis]